MRSRHNPPTEPERAGAVVPASQPVDTDAWRQSGVRPDEVEEWRRLGLDPLEAGIGHADGFAPGIAPQYRRLLIQTASAWRRRGFSTPDALAWHRAGFAPAAAEVCAAAGLHVDEAAQRSGLHQRG